jgi:hypothetical protein
MRWNINDIYLLCQKLTRKNQSAAISASDLFYMWNSEQLMYFNDLIGRWQARANGKSGVNTGLIVNEVSLTDLAAFTIPETLTIAAGKADKPTDFEYRIALRINGQEVQFIRPDQIASVNNSIIDAPSIANNKYYATEYEGYYTFLPTTVTSADLDYIASPENVKWAFTFDADDRQVYNPGLSVQPKWQSSTIVEITKRTLNNFGVSWKDADFANYGKSAQLTGN